MDKVGRDSDFGAVPVVGNLGGRRRRERRGRRERDLVKLGRSKRGKERRRRGGRGCFPFFLFFFFFIFIFFSKEDRDRGRRTFREKKGGRDGKRGFNLNEEGEGRRGKGEVKGKRIHERREDVNANVTPTVSILFFVLFCF